MSDCEDFKSYPNMDAWIRDRQFCDSDEVYTNGSELITVNEVLKGWNYFVNLAEERARADEREKIYDKLDEGVCDICEHRYDGCVKECSENNWELETFMKWLKENN